MPRRASASFSQKVAARDVFVHISAVERAGLHTLTEGQRISFELTTDPRKGKSAADNLKLA